MTLRRATMVFVIAMGVSVVTLPAQAVLTRVQLLVLGADGLAVAGLTRDDFRVTVASQPVTVASAEPGLSPASLVVLFDVSASLDGSYGMGSGTTALRAMIEGWLAASPRSPDRWRFGTFARAVRLGEAFSAETSALRSSLNAILDVPDAERFGPSPAWDAADAGVTALEGERGRRSVVLVTDGRSTGNSRGLVEVVQHAIAAGVPISVVGPAGEQRYSLSESTALIVNATLGLQTLTAETGGGFLVGFGRTVGALPPRPPQGPAPQLPPWLELQPGPLERIALETRSSYLIELAMPAFAGSRRLEVTVTRSGATVRAPASIVAR
jgi:hypothetical protein